MAEVLSIIWALHYACNLRIAHVQHSRNNVATLQALRDDAELRRKQEIHEAEESKNAHIQDLMKKHEKVLPLPYAMLQCAMSQCTTPCSLPAAVSLHDLSKFLTTCWAL